MKKILIKYTEELDQRDYDRFLRLNRIGDRDCHNLLRDDFIAAGRAALIKRMQEV